tara:strand:+ start:3583 stop:3894 length:312 start_codon:yes stop_codon:yes gene_type:complete
MTMKTKYGVKIKGIKPEMVLGLLIAEGYFDSMGISEMVVTSATDGKHGVGSLHYVGYAADVRTWAIQDGDLIDFTTGLSEELGEEFDVVLEKDHIHIEFQPKV